MYAGCFREETPTHMVGVGLWVACASSPHSWQLSRHCFPCSPYPPPLLSFWEHRPGGADSQSDIRGPGVGVEAKARLSRVQYIMVWSHHLFVSPPCLLSTHCVPSALGTEVHSALALPSRSLQSSQLGPQRGVGQNTLLRAHPVVLAVASSITPTASHVVPSKSVLMSSWVQ